MKYFFTIVCFTFFIARGEEWQDTFRFKEVTKTHTLYDSREQGDTIALLKTARFQLKSIDQVLDNENGFFFKRYGNGMLSSPSYRGTNAAQTEVLWNGVLINSPLTGQLDLSLASLLSDKQQLSLNPSTAIGAQVSIAPYFKESDGVEGTFLYQYNTLQSHNISFNLQAKKKWFHSSSDFLSAHSLNRYYFDNPFEKNSRLLLRNGGTAQFSFQQQFRFLLSKKQQLITSFWWVQSDRLLPVFNPNSINTETQTDDSYRAVMSYDGEKGTLMWSASTSLLVDKLTYRNTDLGIKSSFTSKVSRNAISLSKTWLKQQLNTKLSAKMDYENAVSTGFSGGVDRYIYKVEERFLYQHSRWKLTLNIEQALLKNRIIPAGRLEFSYHHSVRKSQFLYLVSAVRTYRIPSLNDLYWAGAGNPNLKPETGWKYEATIRYQQEWIKLKLNAYGQHVADWILWQPTTFSSVWQPSNLKKVFGYGMEMSTTVGLQPGRKKYGCWIEGGYSFSRIKNLEAISQYDESVGKQLIYAPLHKTSIAIFGTWHGVEASIAYQYVGSVFTSTDNSQSMNSYSLVNLKFGKTISFYQQMAIIGFSIYNIANQTFFSIPQHPLPGRYYEFSIKLKLKG